MGEICGKNYEIILHDVSTPERSVIAACNEHLSGRRVGDPMTELAKELLRTGAYKEHDYVANYEGRTRGGKRFVSSTYFILAPECLGGLLNSKTAEGATIYNTAVAYPIGVIFAIAMLAIFLHATKKAAQKA